MREDSSVLSAKKTPKKGGSRTQDDQVKLASDSEFKPAIAFQGAVPGYAFFRGSSGLGYYRDHGPNNLGKVRRSLLDQRGCGTPLLSLSSDVVPLLSLSSDVVQKIWLESEFKPATSFQGAVPGYAFLRGFRGLGYYRDHDLCLCLCLCLCFFLCRCVDHHPTAISNSISSLENHLSLVTLQQTWTLSPSSSAKPLFTSVSSPERTLHFFCRC